MKSPSFFGAGNREDCPFAGNRKIWTADDVRQMFSQLPQVSNFALGRAIEERNLTLALELIAAERKNDAKFVLALYVVTSSLRLLTQVKAMMAKGARQDEIAQTLKRIPTSPSLPCSMHEIIPMNPYKKPWWIWRCWPSLPAVEAGTKDGSGHVLRKLSLH